jgi:hypothetical protein
VTDLFGSMNDSSFVCHRILGERTNYDGCGEYNLTHAAQLLAVLAARMLA